MVRPSLPIAARRHRKGVCAHVCVCACVRMCVCLCVSDRALASTHARGCAWAATASRTYDFEKDPLQPLGACTVSTPSTRVSTERAASRRYDFEKDPEWPLRACTHRNRLVRPCAG